ncbi:Heimdall-CTERM domain-containing surface protein [Candidatus Hodarchaeum mangrovi]
MKRKILFGSSVILLLMILTFTSPASAATFAGHDFTEEYFAVEVDLAVPDPSQPDVISDLLNAAAPIGDSNEDFDIQFYMNYMNNSGIETAFSALEKVEYDLKFGDLLSSDVKTVLEMNPAYDEALEASIFHINATAPFQQLVQHYKTPWAEDVFVTNNFMSLIAYSSSPDDQIMDSGDEIFMGYTFSAQELIDAVNTVLSNNGKTYQIGYFDYNPYFEKTATGFKFGIDYSNMFVLWQSLAIKPRGVNIFGQSVPTAAVQSETNGIIFGQDIVAASVLDFLNFEYIFETQTITGANEYVLGTVTTHYNIGETNLLVVKETSIPSEEWSFSPFLATPSYTFNIPSVLVGTPIPIAGVNIPSSVTINLPELAFYIDDDAKTRMRLANSFGLTVATATTTFGLSVSDPTYEDNLDQTTSTIDIAMGGNTFFFTEFTGKNTYKLLGLQSLFGIDPTVDRPVHILPFDPAGWIVTNVAHAYFVVEFALAYGFTKFLAEQLSPQLFTMPSKELYINWVLYFTFTEFPEWYGGEILHDPSYSAVAALSVSGASSTTAPPGSDTTGLGIPGFELISVLLAIPPLYALYRKRRR